MKDRSRLILLAVAYLLVVGFGAWLLTLPVLLQFLIGQVRSQATVMAVGFLLIVSGAVGLTSTIRKF